MATFSSPAPSRRSSRAQSRPPGHSPPVVQPRRTKGGGSSRPATSRLATPVRNIQEPRLQTIRDDVSGSQASSSGMDVDDDNTSLIFERAIRSETVFAKSQQMAVSFYSNLPVEVKQVLKNADFYRHSYTGDVDPVTGFALVASFQTCFVWNHAQALVGTPTCYIFACPPSEKLCPLHALIPYGPSREPGLILASVTGEIRLWDSIGIGLAGGEHYSTLFLQMDGEAREVLTTLTRVDAQTFVTSTSIGRLFRLVLTSTGGKYHLAPHPFSRPLSSLSFSRIFPLWSSSVPPTERGYINSVSLGKQTTVGREIWSIIDTRVQIWSMTFEGFEELIVEEELGGVLQTAVWKTAATTSKSSSELDLELLDLVVESSTKAVFLVSYAGTEEDYNMIVTSQPRRIYALARVSFFSGVFKIESVTGVPYQSTSSSGAPMHPRIQSIHNGALIAVQFGDAVALCARDTEYIDRLELKSATDRTLGVGVLNSDGELLILTAATTMKVYVDMDQIAKFDRETGRATLIKSIMTQAILYGSYPENPLHFSFPPEVDEESLMTGAEQLSQAILESDSEVIRPNHDINAQMVMRKDRLSFLIKFINDNAALNKMSRSSRQRLAIDAEKLYASHQLWLRHSEFLATGQRRSVLNDAVYAYMNHVGEGHHEDFMRAFFRLKVRDLGELITWIMHLLNRLEQETAASHGIAPALCEANRAILTILTSAVEYRRYNLGVYGIELPIHDPWTARSETMDFVVRLFELTTKVVESPGSSTGSAGMGVDSAAERDIPRLQLAELASVMFACFHERLEWLKSPVAANEVGTDREMKPLEDRFNQLRPEVLDTLRKHDHAQYAFKLAEDYHDFRSLVLLCHKDRVYPPGENPHVIRIQSYIDKFREEFTTELYQWYIEHGELRSMFMQDDMYSGYLDKFFVSHSYPGISWIHDVDKRRYGDASTSLLAESKNAVDLDTKHLMLSIGKLTHLAQLQDNDASVDKSALNAFHDGLDIISVHEALLEEFKGVKSLSRAKQSLESQVDVIFKSRASRLVHRPAHARIFKLLVRQVIQGKALPDEDIIDLLSLKDNEERVEDFVTALHILSRIQGLPEARQVNAFRSVWRRIYIHDDWNAIRQTVDVTDHELNEKFRNTALYAALRADPKYILEPQQALGIPSPAEISSRWPGMPPDQADAVEDDYREESETLRLLELEHDFARVAELAASDNME